MDLRPAFCYPVLLVLLLLVPVSASKLYIVYMGEKHHDVPSVVTALHHDILSSVLGSNVEAQKSIVYSYKHGFSGFAAMLTESQAQTIAGLPGVISVKPNTYHQTHTTRSWDFLGLDNYHQSSGSDLLKNAKYGEDIIVGVLDSGIWPESRSFDDSGYGLLPARWKGTCQSGTTFNATSCNKKIIGARWYAGGMPAEELKGEYMSPRDLSGHGTHVASTIAGSEVRNASFVGLGLGAGVARGGAPRARLAVYKVCWGQDGSCGDAAVLAAIDDAINDGVDNAVPWVLTVAASTIDRSFPTMISLGNKKKLVQGQSLFIALVNSNEYFPLIAPDSCDEDWFASTNVTGMVVLCSAPSEASDKLPPKGFHEAGNLVVKAGAKGLIFAQDNSNLLEASNFPYVLVDYGIAHRIRSYANTVEKPIVKISPAVSMVGNGVLSPRVAAFSSRGPSPTFPGIIKPDIAAPGVSILAAVGSSYQFKSGTSMSCPHVSAIVALLKLVHPDWSPAIIKSAIVTSASVTDRFGMPIQAEGAPRKLADPFDFGGGHINPDKAADPGLVYDVDAREYTKFFNCTLGPKDDCDTYAGQLYQLNLPSIAVSDLKGSVVVSRTVTNVGSLDATYRVIVEAPPGVDMSVEPSVIRFNYSSKTAKFQVTFRAKQWVQGGYTFGSLTWLDDNTHSVRIPVAVRTVIEDFIADTS
ncbi:hypothetical protein QOZ80_2AG0108860 [Eleusine coracana subsp. coracana]|nr:hypothetical protein QOZ80_2AG0108860 [Eleusine coracana subsp. coracana]